MTERLPSSPGAAHSVCGPTEVSTDVGAFYMWTWAWACAIYSPMWGLPNVDMGMGMSMLAASNGRFLINGGFLHGGFLSRQELHTNVARAIQGLPTRLLQRTTAEQGETAARYGGTVTHARPPPGTWLWSLLARRSRSSICNLRGTRAAHHLIVPCERLEM